MPRTFDYTYDAPSGEQMQLRVFYEVANARNFSWDEHLEPSDIQILEVLELGDGSGYGNPIELDNAMREQIIYECLVDYDDDSWSYDED